jgi:hypothetical protein
MDRRKALVTAGAVSLTAAAAAAAVGANFGLFGLAEPRGGLGKLSPVAATELDRAAGAVPATTTLPPVVETVYVEEPPASGEPAPHVTSGRSAEREAVADSGDTSSPPQPPPAALPDPAPPTATSTTTSPHFDDDHATEPGHDREPDD